MSKRCPDDDIFAAFGHLALSAASLNGLFNYDTETYGLFGSHLNYFIHGIIGFLKSQSSYCVNVNSLFTRTYPAAKFLGIACLMADLWHKHETDESSSPSDLKILPRLHLVSGLLPFFLELIGKETKSISNLAISFNILSLVYYCNKKRNTWAWLTLYFAAFTYFIAPLHDTIKCSCTFATKAMFPLGLAMTEVCATRALQGTPDSEKK